VLRARVLIDGAALSVLDVACPGGGRARGPEEAARRWELVLPRRGAFVHHRGARATVADAGCALVFRPDEGYRVSHPAPGADACTVIALGPALADELLGASPPPDAPVAAAVDLAHRRLVARLLRSEASPRELGDEEAALALAAALPFARPPGPTRATPARARLVARARELIAAAPTERLRLDALARAVGCSPFHLCRAFRDATGTTLRRHQARLRVRAALDRLATDGSADLTALALELGFADHSHFTNTFRAETGLTPSAWRASVGRRA
jgi:AraC-like DNA-binding protein